VITQSRVFNIALSGALLITLIAAVPVMGQNVKTKSNPNRDISKFNRYAWKQSKITLAQTPEVVAKMDQKLQDAVNRVLARKGYVEYPQNPDFLIQVVAYGLPDMQTSANVDVGHPFDATTVYTSQRPDGPGISVWVVVISNVSFILSDRSSNEVAWQADVTKKYKDPQKAIRNLDKEIQNVVKKALKDLPAHKK
jgi:hypothetical protein